MKTKKRIIKTKALFSLIGVSLCVPILSSCATEPVKQTTNNTIANNEQNNGNNNENLNNWPFKIGDNILIAPKAFEYGIWNDSWVGTVTLINNIGIATKPIKYLKWDNGKYVLKDFLPSYLPNSNGIFATWNNIQAIVY